MMTFGDGRQAFAILGFSLVLILMTAVTIIRANNDTQNKPIDQLDQHRKGPRLFAPRILDPYRNARDGSLTPDGKYFYFTEIVNEKYRIMVCQRTRKDGHWTTPKIAPFSGKYDDFEARVSPDGRRLFFASRRPGKTKTVKKGDIDIWVIDRNGDRWTVPHQLNPHINSECMEYFPSVTADGTLYFGRNDKAMTRGDIYFSKPVNGVYTKAIKLPANVNLPGTSFNAFIAPDESYILFSSYIKQNERWHSELMISFKQSEGWSDPFVFNSPVNSLGNDHAAMVSPDGKALYFSSTRNKMKEGQKNHNIFWIDSQVITDIKLGNNNTTSKQGADT